MSNEEVKNALEVIQRHTVQTRGDSFDIGENINEQSFGGDSQIIEILQNPAKLAQSLNLTKKQAENIAAMITGGGAGVSSKYLSQYFGNEIAGAIGGLIGGHIARKLMKER